MPEATNPFAAPSPLQFEYPPFDRIGIDDYRAAFDAGVAEQDAEIAAIVADPAEPDFDNTIGALERSGRMLDRALRVFFELSGSMATEQMQEVLAELAPLDSAHEDAIMLNPGLFARVDAVYRKRAELELTEEQSRVLDRYHTDFVRAGAALSPEDQVRLRQLNEQITTLTTEFGRQLLAEANSLAVHVDDVAELDGLPESAVEAARTAAQDRGVDGYLITLLSPTIQPALASVRSRDLRRRIFEAATSRGMRGGDHDTRELLTTIAATRATRAGLFGYPNHAAYVVADQTAGTSEAVLGMLDQMCEPAMANLETERAEIEAAMAADGVEGAVQPWDWSYYAARVKAGRYDLDTDALRPYFELDRVLHDGIFFAANRLYGVTFKQRTDLPTYAPGVRVYQVDDHDGTTLGLFICDWFARPTKRGGAWMDSFVAQSRLLNTRPVIVVCLNVPHPPEGHPALMTIDEVRTGFHEFGHALHGLFASAEYPRLSGTRVPRDFVEFPSQVNEVWAWDPDVLANYARHCETGEALDPAVAERLRASQAFGQGFDTVAMLGAALLDQEWHRLAPGDPAVAEDDVAAFERSALERHGVASDLVPPRYRSGYFAHSFTNGYDAGYYSYLWSEVLDADMVDWFKEHGGLTRENGDRFRDLLLSRGGTTDPVAAFAAVRGRPPSTEPLLRRRGLLDGPH